MKRKLFGAVSVLLTVLTLAVAAATTVDEAGGHVSGSVHSVVAMEDKGPTGKNPI